MATPSRPEIFLLSLAYRDYLDEMYSYLIDKLAESTQLKRAQAPNGALRYLEENNPRAIIVTDEGLTDRKNRNVLEKVLKYARNGGLVIIGLHFPSFTNMDAFRDFFNRGCGLPWKNGDYHRTNFAFNPSCGLPAGTVESSIPGPYSMKVLHVKDARPEEKIFVPVSGAATQSRVFPPSYVDESQAAVVGAKMGDGYFVYCGDVNAEEESSRVILALCGI